MGYHDTQTSDCTHNYQKVILTSTTQRSIPKIADRREREREGRETGVRTINSAPCGALKSSFFKIHTLKMHANCPYMHHTDLVEQSEW